MNNPRCLGFAFAYCVALVLAIPRLTLAQETAVAEPPAKNTAITPVPRDTAWMQKHEKINERAKQGDVDLLFIGDSITEGWSSRGKDVWEKYYGNRKAMNAGIGGDKTEHVLWRLDHGNVDGIHPKLTVIMIGTNNSPGDVNSASNIADGIKAIVNEVHEKLPDTKILLLGIFPRGAVKDAQIEKQLSDAAKKKKQEPEITPGKIADAREKTLAQRKKIAEASQLASRIADNKTIFYVDIGDKFLEADGTLPEDIMPDFLHPNAKGYEIWAEAIEPKVAEVLGEKK